MRPVSSESTGFAVLRREANEGGYFRPIIKEVVERYLDCGNPRCGFALMNRNRFMRTAKRCPDPVSLLPGGAAFADLFQVQAPALGGSLPISEQCLDGVFQGRDGERTRPRRHRRRPDLRGPDQLSPAPPLSNHDGGATPVPIPNTEVKPSSADGTARAAWWESRMLPGLFSYVSRARRIKDEGARALIGRILLSFITIDIFIFRDGRVPPGRTLGLYS